MNELTVDPNSFPFSLSDREPVVYPTVIDIAIEKLSTLKIVSITFTKDKEKIVGFFTAEKNKESFYNKDANTLTVTNFINNREYTINESDIIQVGYPVNEEGIQTFELNAQTQKEEYIQLVEAYKATADFSDVVFMTETECYAMIYGISIEELTDLEKCKTIVFDRIKNAVDIEVQTLTQEFGILDSTDPLEVESISGELACITEFLVGVKQDYSIFNEADDYKKIIKCWPVILEPSFFSVFTKYADKYFS